MSNTTNNDVFLWLVSEAHGIHGGSAPAITDYIMERLFFISSSAAKTDGNYAALRRGVMDQVRRILKNMRSRIGREERNGSDRELAVPFRSYQRGRILFPTRITAAHLLNCLTFAEGPLS